MKFITFEKDGYLEVDFPDESGSKRWLLNCFLEDSRHNIQGRLQEIEQAKKNENTPTGITGDTSI